MARYDDPASASLRLSNADRDAAVTALSRSLADGRITADEFTERSTAARSALTRGDLAPLFADLPEIVHPDAVRPDTVQPDAVQPDTVHPDTGHPATGHPDATRAFPDAPPPASVAPAPGYRAADPSDRRYDTDRRRPLGGSTGVIVVSIMPFIALGLFFLCGYLIPDGFRWSWIFFGLIPVAGIIVYGAGSRRPYDRD
jgi:hypothetical protein